VKLPLGIIARFALKVAAKAAAKQALDSSTPLTVDSAKKALAAAAEEEVLRQVAKRAG